MCQTSPVLTKLAAQPVTRRDARHQRQLLIFRSSGQENAGQVIEVRE